MFNFLKRKSQDEPIAENEDQPQQKQGWLKRLSSGLKRTRENFSEGLTSIFLGKKTIDDEVLEELESRLLLADVGVDTTQAILDNLTKRVKRNELADPEALIQALKEQLEALLIPYNLPLEINTKPYVILMVGVNGAGKTTSIAKIAHYYQLQNKKILLAAGDTFRAAAVEQLKVWGERNNVPVISQHIGADSASVIYDAMEAATARNVDILIADTAGRLHTQDHLMAELQKIKRVIQKINPDAPQETMLVIDATMGQNAINQAEQFNKAINLTGITLTKLDGTAKGGIIFAVSDKMKLPIRFIGVGEQLDDLRPFEAKAFVEAMISA